MVWEHTMDRIALGAALVAVPLAVLSYLGYRVVGSALRLYRNGRTGESLALLGTTIFAVGLVGKFGTEKSLLVGALLSWMFLAAQLISLLLGQNEPEHPRNAQFANTPEDQDPNSLNYSGVGPGSQGFGVYAGGVRIAHDHFEDD
jgi:hypothetical protein